MIKNIFLLILFAHAIQVNAQSMMKYYGSSAEDNFGDIIHTSDGGYLMAGYSGSLSTGAYGNIYSLDSNGTILWQKDFGGPYVSVAETQNHFLLLGHQGSGPSLLMFFVRISKDGNDTLFQNFSSSNHDFTLGAHVMETNDNKILLAGNANKWIGNSFLSNIYLVKIDTNGSEIWKKTFTGSKGTSVVKMLPLNDGGFMLLGNTSSWGAGSLDYYIMRLNKFGDSLWTKTYGTALTETSMNIEMTSDSGYIITGTQNVSGSLKEAYFVRIDKDGNQLWDNNLGNINKDYICGDIIGTSNTQYTFVCYENDYNAGVVNGLIVYTDSIGDTTSTTFIGDFLRDIGLIRGDTLQDGGYWLAGQGYEVGGIEQQLFLIETNTTGESPIGIPDNDWNLNFGMHPNPAHGEVSFTFEASINKPVIVEIYNILGSLVISSEVAFQKTLNIDIRSLPGGSYIVKVQQDGRNISRLLVVE